MPTLANIFDLERCPHCCVHKPTLSIAMNIETDNHKKTNKRRWCCYVCANCGGVVLAVASKMGLAATEIYPNAQTVDGAVPDRAKTFLEQAIDSIHAPAGAVMLTASSVDAMLKEKNYKNGSLYSRIDQAAKDNLITNEMAQWAHEVRLDANDQRHADENALLPSGELGSDS